MENLPSIVDLDWRNLDNGHRRSVTPVQPSQGGGGFALGIANLARWFPGFQAWVR